MSEGCFHGLGTPRPGVCLILQHSVVVLAVQPVGLSLIELAVHDSGLIVDALIAVLCEVQALRIVNHNEVTFAQVLHHFCLLVIYLLLNFEVVVADSLDFSSRFVHHLFTARLGVKKFRSVPPRLA